MTMMDLAYYINIGDKEVVGFERIDFNFESCTVSVLQIALLATQNYYMKGRVN
jgi:hypothetical protein